MDMCNVSLEDMEKDEAYIEELNGWIQNEMEDLGAGYEEYTNYE